MTLVEGLSLLYAASGVAGCACYVPQLARLARSAEARRGMALASWAGWLCLSLIAVLYAALVVGQGVMVVVCGGNALCQAMVVAMVAGQHCRDRRQSKRAGTLAVPAR
jgi:predicted anti-sigma-YlaC factor YlaD